MSDGAIAQLLLVGAAANRPAVHDHLRRHGYETLTAASAAEATHLLARWKVACVVADAELENGRVRVWSPGSFGPNPVSPWCCSPGRPICGPP